MGFVTTKSPRLSGRSLEFGGSHLDGEGFKDRPPIQGTELRKVGNASKAVSIEQSIHGRQCQKNFPLLKLIALSNPLGVHGLFRSLVVAFLAVAVRSNSGLRTAIIRMLVFHRTTSALPAHWWPRARCAFYTGLLSKTTYFRLQDDPCGGRGAPTENA
jgi:hypothetical protein